MVLRVRADPEGVAVCPEGGANIFNSWPRKWPCRIQQGPRGRYPKIPTKGFILPLHSVNFIQFCILIHVNCCMLGGWWLFWRPKNVCIYITSCPGAPVAPRRTASHHADRHYGQSRNMNIKPSVTLDDRVKVSISTSRKSSGHSSVSITRTFAEKPCMCDQSRSSIRVY